MKKVFAILLALFVLTSGFRVTIDTNSKMKAIFIMNFTKLLEWPPSYRKNTFIIGVVGNSPIYKELEKMSATKKVANQTLKVVKYDNISNISDCHIVYLSQNKSETLHSLTKKISSKSTLIITEKEGLIDKGAGINFIVRNNRQKFELHKKNIEKHQLKINSTLEALALVVK